MHLINKRDVERIDPAKTLHLCIDVQDYYFNPSYAGRKTSPRRARRINEVATAFNGAGIKTIWLYHDVVDIGQKFYIVEPQPGDRVMPKAAFSAFSSTPLDDILRERRIENLILTGGYTNYCVSETARDALTKGYNAFVLLDCVEATRGFAVNAASLRRKFSVATATHDLTASFIMSAPLLDRLAVLTANESSVDRVKLPAVG